MPIYAYRCTGCGHAQDVLRKLSDPALTQCPACGAATFEKQVTAAGFQLKGSGWYVTDFRNNGAPAKAASDKPAAPGDGAPAAAADAKAAPAAEAAGNGAGPGSKSDAPSTSPAPAAPAVSSTPSNGT